ncbi:MAG: aldehyde:ferredoxin oxidoreductase [Thermoproteota archaeon]|nr:aldehyde:ferredoxin oxidoreductase [Thermoproteota archaeon]
MSKQVNGYAGKFLRVNLTSEHLSNTTFNEETLRKYLGGTGIGSRILYDEIPPKALWSDPVNRVTIASGPLGGTSIPGSGTISIVTKGALTNGATSVQANGRFGAYLKFSGFDGIIIQGQAKRWLYLQIEDGKAELKDANHLLGLDTYTTGDIIREELGRKEIDMSVISIGPAGENQVRFAGTFVDKGHSASHNGTGAVIGSKKLKAIAAARGGERVEVKDAEKLNAIGLKFRERTKDYRGTIGGVERGQRSGQGTLPIKNYSTNVWTIADEELDKFSEPYIRGHYEPRRSPCFGCPANHSTMMVIPEGAYKGMLVEEPEYEQMAAWGPVIDNKDAAAAAMLSGLNDRLGFENNEAGWLIGWVMECYDKGYLTKDDIGGLKANWGNIEATKQLLYMTAHRQGFGDVLADGVMRASQKIGGKAAECAVYTMKGNSPRGHDHRTTWGELFDTTISNTGTLETHRMLMDPKAGNEPGNPKETSTAVAITKGNMEFEDSIGTCRFNTMTNMMLIAEAISAATGWDYTAEEGKTVGLRSVNLMKAFNIRTGITREQDYPSARYGSTHIDGKWKGIGIMPHWEEMLDNYYSLMGWEIATSKPLPETLKKLGLEEIIEDIW